MAIEGARLAVLNGMPKGSICAEIGVYKGDYSEAILSVVKPNQLHLIDPWRFQVDKRYDSSWYGGATGKDQENMDSIYNSVQKRFANEIKAGVVGTHRLPSDQAAGSFKDGYFDWVYIDGDHQYKYVKKDLENFYKKVKVGGFLVCDDYGIQGWWDDGVLKAVHEFLLNNHCKVAFMAGTQFVIQKTN